MSNSRRILHLHGGPTWDISGFLPRWRLRRCCMGRIHDFKILNLRLCKYKMCLQPRSAWMPNFDPNPPRTAVMPHPPRTHNFFFPHEASTYAVVAVTVPTPAQHSVNFLAQSPHSSRIGKIYSRLTRTLSNWSVVFTMINAGVFKSVSGLTMISNNQRTEHKKIT